jgi:hypothetical protein
MKLTFRIGGVAACLLAAGPFAMNGANRPSPVSNADQPFTQEHSPGSVARITMHDGATRTVKLQGVGCPQGICSRTAIKAKDQDSVVQTRFDSLTQIKDITPTDALFVLKDGTSRRLSLIYDFRVLYLANRLGGIDKLDLAAVKTVEFIAPAR